MKFCKYCKDFSIEALPYRTNTNEDLISLIALKEDGNKEIVVHLMEIGAFGIQINYCPMCGRSLNKKD